MSKHKEDRSVHVQQREKLKDGLIIREFPWTEKQKEFISLATNKETKLIFLNGPAGTAKTILSVYIGLKLLNEKRISDILYVRTVVESASKGLGYLPGESEDKFRPFILPLLDKLDELLQRSQIDKLLKDERIKSIPVNYLRGTSFNAKLIISDESQNFDFKELTTLITRVGQFTKMIVCGDSMQSDINGKSGFKEMAGIFDNEESRANGIYSFEFDNDDIVRSELVKFIVKKLDAIDKK